MATKHWAYRGRGELHVKRVGVNERFRSLGNCSNATFAAETEKVTQQNYMSVSGGNIASEESISGMTLSLTLLNLSPENIAMAFRGAVYDQEADSVDGEVHTAYSGALVPFAYQPDLTKEITVTDGDGVDPVTYVVNVDYELKAAGVSVIEGGAIEDGSEIEVSYTKSLAAVVQALTEAGAEYELLFDGMNAADSGKAGTLRAWRVKFSPTSGFGLITDSDFGELPVEGEVLADPSKVGVVSQYFQYTAQR